MYILISEYINISAVGKIPAYYNFFLHSSLVPKILRIRIFGTRSANAPITPSTVVTITYFYFILSFKNWLF